ncbi:tyrosine-type recombinase/integrase [Acutalibacter intestini]|uniref:tyrosine-type recombinase/integrase n=1 Tax=Acutalibacter intestini TaxID=3093659 RepID=UPI0034602AE0
MTFNDIDWENSRICVLQKKTKETLQLPLSGEIGNAIIEYLRYGRPNSDFRTIFLRHHPPIRPIISSSVHCMIQRYFSAAGTDTQGKKHGPHALRHSLATNILKNDIPLPTISEVLGHTTTTSTQIYLKIDLNKLSKCALPVLGEEDSL